MKFLADRETRRQLLTLLVLAAAGGWLCFSLSWQAGCLVLALCCLFSLMTLRCTWRRYRSTEALCADLDRLLHGDSSVCLDAYTEGAWSLLHSQLTKLLIRLQEQASRSEQDKKKLAAFLADISHQIRTPLTALNLLGHSWPIHRFRQRSGKGQAGSCSGSWNVWIGWWTPCCACPGWTPALWSFTGSLWICAV